MENLKQWIERLLTKLFPLDLEFKAHMMDSILEHIVRVDSYKD